MKSDLKYWVAGISTPVIWGFFAIVIRNISAYPTEQIMLFRVISSFSILWLLLVVFRYKALRQAVLRIKETGVVRALFLLFISGVCLATNWYVFILVVNHVSVQAGALAYLISPLLTTVGGFMVEKGKPSLNQKIGIMISLIAVLMLCRDNLANIGWSVLVAAAYTSYVLIQRKLQGYDKLVTLGFQLFLAGLFIIPVLLYQSDVSVPDSSYFWVNILVISVFFTILPLFLNLFSMTRIPASTLGVLLYLNPIISFIVAFLYFGEGFSVYKAFSYLILIAGIVWFNIDVLKKLILKDNAVAYGK